MVGTKVGYAWCAGFFDGEGSTSVNYQFFKGKLSTTRLVVQIAQVKKSPLLKFHALIGKLGKVRGPYGPYAANKQASFQYSVNNSLARTVLKRMWPFLSDPKKQQAKICLKEIG